MRLNFAHAIADYLAHHRNAKAKPGSADDLSKGRVRAQGLAVDMGDARRVAPAAGS